ncbi:hypothetical protein BASA81_001317 [Batrachochytrium salamandrivorans]|nr:hypothetical protein BASA81_001317 [Batrachochytrium salamandrivorans]
MLILLALLLRVAFVCLSVSVVFPRSSWVCDIAGQQCASLWDLNSQVSQAFSILTPVFGAMSVWWFFHRHLSSPLLVVAFACSVVDWAVVAAQAWGGNEERLDWGFTLAVLSSLFALLSFVLVPCAGGKQDQLLLKVVDSRVVLFLTGFGFACSFGGMVSFLQVDTSSAQYQAACGINLAFAVMQLVLVCLVQHWIVRGGDSFTLHRLRCLQVINAILAWTAFGLFAHRNVLPVPIPSANVFYVQGFVLGAALASTAVLSLLWMIQGPRKPTKLSVMPELAFTLCFTIVLALGFGSLSVFVYADTFWLFTVVQGCFLFNVLAVLLLQMEALAYDGKFHKRILLLCIGANVVGFAVKVGHDHTLTFSSGCALAGLVCELGLGLLEVCVHRPALTTPLPPPSAREFDPELDQCRHQLLNERQKLQDVKRKLQLT